MARKRFGGSIGPDDETPTVADSETAVYAHSAQHDINTDKNLPWLEGAPDSYDDEEERLVPRSWLMGGLAAFLLLLGLSVFFIYKHVGGRNANQDQLAANVDPSKLPLIEAPKGPIKVQPGDPGGMKVPNQDLQAYNVASGETKPEPTKLGQPAEQPLPHPVATKPQPQKIAPPIQVAAVPVTTVEKPIVNLKPIVPKVAKTQLPKAVDPKPVETASEPAATEPAKAKVPAKLTTNVSGGVYIQLGAFSTRERADAAWGKASADYSELKGLGHNFQIAGPAKIRLRVGPVPRADADGICANLKQQGQACLIAR